MNQGLQNRSPLPWKKVLILLVFVGGFSAFFLLGGDRYVNFATLKANRDRLMDYTQNHYWFILMGSMIVYTASTALSLPLATPLSLTTGFLFGVWVGTAAVLFSATLGATLAFLAARYVFAESVSRRMGSRVRKVISVFHTNDFNYLLFLRLVPLFPFWLINLAAAFTPVKVQVYVAATAIGMIPGAFVFTNLGQSLGRIDSPDQLLSFNTISALVLLGIFSLIPVFVKKVRSVRAEKGAVK